MDVRLFGMEIFVKRSSHNTVRVNIDTEFLGNFIDVGVIPKSIARVLSLASLLAEDHEIASCLYKLLKVVNFGERENIPWTVHYEEIGLLDLFILNVFLVQTNLNKNEVTLNVSLYFLTNFLRLVPGLPCSCLLTSKMI